MKKQTIIIIIVLIITTLTTNVIKSQSSTSFHDSKRTTQSNNCFQDEISNQFDIHVFFKRNVDTITSNQECTIKVKFYDKISGNQMDSVIIESDFIYSFMFLSCNSMTSYSTGYNSTRNPIDNFFGDIVVSDFNFDGKDDIAIIKNGGGNSGPDYAYFIQKANLTFDEEKFLTDKMGIFPSNIDKTNKTLTTLGHAGACFIGERIFQLDEESNNWKIKSYKIIDVCEK